MLADAGGTLACVVQRPASAAGNLLVARDPLATGAAADHVYSCAGERILSIIPAGPPPAISMSPASGHLRRPGRKPLWVLIVHSGDRSRNVPRFGGHSGSGARAVEKYRHRSLGIRQDAGHTLKTAGSTCDLKGQSTAGHPMH